ncbi:reticulon-4-interacting protein 1, mitochondrial-like [Rhodamnia argentea]|uniref:Reticulon-4-interacting protein 1, mitochondrial-like n=1 Tax=Rhodamnia argentea TaxID=178133 RepID=A0A8B8PUA3_9MYRT|nr:reticulon-4-interacting protein 1, mitochondrial-like [Rhodamnia argentea]
MLRRFGSPEVLEFVDKPLPHLKDDEVLVRTRAVSINPIDFAMRSGTGYGYSVFKRLLPLILGRDISGEVVAVGASVQSFTVGEEVFGALHPSVRRGTYTDYAIVSEFHLTQKPKSITHEEASAIPFAALTAWRALKETAKIREGERVLVIGGGGAVGFAAIQLAVAHGCQVVTFCSSQSIDRALAAGAEQAVDYIAENIKLAIKGEFDAVLDTIGGLKTERIGINFLKRGGHYVTLQADARSTVFDILMVPGVSDLFGMKNFNYYCYYGIDYSYAFMESNCFGLEEIRDLSEAGRLYIPVDRTFPIAQVKEAHEAKEKRKILGKVVLEFS